MSTIDHLFPRARREIIRLLFTDPEVSLHLRDLARQSGLAIGTIQGEVSNLRDAGLLLEQRDGNRLYFRANPDNPIFAELQAIARKTTGLRDQLLEALESITGIEFAFVYGSFASNQATSGSDIDLFIVGTTGLRQLASPLREVSFSINREVNVNTYSKTSYIKQLKEGDAYIQNVAQSTKLWIIGSDDKFRKLA